MANIVPGAVWQPVDVGNRQARIKGRGAVGHVAVSSSPNLVPSGTAATRNADWHFYLPKVGNADGSVRFFQYIDLDLQCWASMEGNRTLPAWESEGGMGSEAQVNAEPWTENQLQAGAIIYAHLNRTEGAPLQVMPDSRPTSRGLAAHRFGIDPWRVAGGEMWSGPGKLCPGSEKVDQLAEVIARATVINNPEDDMPLTDADIEKIAQRTRAVIADGTLPYGLDNLRRKLDALSAQVATADANDAPEILTGAILKALPAPTSGGLTEADVETAIRKVLGGLDNQP